MGSVEDICKYGERKKADMQVGEILGVGFWDVMNDSFLMLGAEKY